MLCIDIDLDTNLDYYWLSWDEYICWWRWSWTRGRIFMKTCFLFFVTSGWLFLFQHMKKVRTCMHYNFMTISKKIFYIFCTNENFCSKSIYMTVFCIYIWIRPYNPIGKVFCLCVHTHACLWEIEVLLNVRKSN